MNDQTTERFDLPLLAAGQVAKELTHNEALTLVDLLLQPAVQTAGIDTPPAAPVTGQCWIVGTQPVGAWQGHAGALAAWTGGGWRFVAPTEGFVAWSISAAKTVAYRNGLWHEGDLVAARLTIGGRQVVGPQMAAIADPAGGSVVDEAARNAVTAMLNALRSHGLIAA